MGHAKVTTTLTVYAHLFNTDDHTEAMSALDAMATAPVQAYGENVIPLWGYLRPDSEWVSDRVRHGKGRTLTVNRTSPIASALATRGQAAESIPTITIGAHTFEWLRGRQTPTARYAPDAPICDTPVRPRTCVLTRRYVATQQHKVLCCRELSHTSSSV